jgi:hypothetical protein
MSNIKKQYDLYGFTGLVQLRRTKSGAVVGIYSCEQSGIDGSEEDAWTTVCEGHGSTVTHRTLADAKAHAPHPDGWCESCQKGEPASCEPETIEVVKQVEKERSERAVFRRREAAMKKDAAAGIGTKRIAEFTIKTS